MATFLQITCTSNALLKQSYQFIDEQSQPVNLTGYTFNGQFKVPPGTGAAVLTISTANGRVNIIDATNGFLDIQIPGNLIDPGEYVFDLLATVAGTPYIFALGTLTVLQGVTS